MVLSVAWKVRHELARIQKITGDRPEDWLYQVAEEASDDWSDRDAYGDIEYIDVDSVMSEIETHADMYIDFVRENYPEQIIGEA